MAGARDPRQVLIKEVWPDKLLYGTLLIAISSAMGLIHGLLVLITDIRFSDNLAPWFDNYPPLLTVAFSLIALGLALYAWRTLKIGLGVLAALFSVASFSLFGIGPLHALAALVFLYLAKREGEDKVHHQDRVTRWDWPDKAFAASLLLLLSGTTSIAWGLGVIFDQVSVVAEAKILWGIAQVATGILAMVGAQLLYHQRAPLLAGFAAVLNVITLGGYVIAPGLAVAALIAIALAWQENEFQDTATTSPASTDPPPG